VVWERIVKQSRKEGKRKMLEIAMKKRKRRDVTHKNGLRRATVLAWTELIIQLHPVEHYWRYKQSVCDRSRGCHMRTENRLLYSQTDINIVNSNLR
jgi:hypothetical protein